MASVMRNEEGTMKDIESDQREEKIDFLLVRYIGQ
jgi:hypothetical protein